MTKKWSFLHIRQHCTRLARTVLGMSILLYLCVALPLLLLREVIAGAIHWFWLLIAIAVVLWYVLWRWREHTKVMPKINAVSIQTIPKVVQLGQPFEISIEYESQDFSQIVWASVGVVLHQHEGIEVKQTDILRRIMPVTPTKFQQMTFEVCIPPDHLPTVEGEAEWLIVLRLGAGGVSSFAHYKCPLIMLPPAVVEEKQ